MDAMAVKHQEMLDKMQQLQPLRNIRAMQLYVDTYKANMSGFIAQVVTDAAMNNKSAIQVLLFMSIGFAAGRAYQQANPEAPADPDGYQ